MPPLVTEQAYTYSSLTTPAPSRSLAMGSTKQKHHFAHKTQALIEEERGVERSLAKRSMKETLENRSHLQIQRELPRLERHTRTRRIHGNSRPIVRHD